MVLIHNSYLEQLPAHQKPTGELKRTEVEAVGYRAVVQPMEQPNHLTAQSGVHDLVVVAKAASCWVLRERWEEVHVRLVQDDRRVRHRHRGPSAMAQVHQ